MVLMFLAVLMLGGCTEVEDSGETNFDDGKIQETNAVLTVINDYDEEHEIYVYYCNSLKDITLYFSKKISAGSSINIPITKNKIKISFAVESYKDFEGNPVMYNRSFWGFVNGDFTLKMKHTERDNNFEVVCVES